MNHDQQAHTYANRAYLAQQGLEFTPENVLMNGLDNVKYVATVGVYIITTHEDDQAGNFLNIVNKETLEMTTLDY